MYTVPSHPSDWSESGTDIDRLAGWPPLLGSWAGVNSKLELVHIRSVMPHPIEELTSPASWSLVRDFAVNVPRPFDYRS